MPAAQVDSGSCVARAAVGHVYSPSCEFVLTDGRRFRCRRVLSNATDSALRAAACVELPSYKVSPAQRSLAALLDATRECLTRHGLRVLGGPVLPPDSRTPDGELVISSSHPTFIAFYTSVAKAQRLEGTPINNARKFHGLVERHGTLTILWTAAPASRLHHAVLTCIPG
jgi:hypothetical protein